MVPVTRVNWRRRRRVPYLPQMEVTECGAACLGMVLAFHGHHASPTEVRQACAVSRDGASALAIVRAARGYGLSAEGVRLEVDQLAQLRLPAILHWDFNHFVILERLTSNWAFLVDPARGRYRVWLAELRRHFTGVALVFVPTESFRKRPRSRPSLARYRETVRAVLPSLGQILLASLTIQVVGLFFPVANQLLLDRAVGPKQEPWLWAIAFGLGGAVIARVLLCLVRSYVLQGLRNLLDFTLMRRFLDHLLHLPLGFFLQRQAGDLMQRVESNATVRHVLGSQSVSALLDGCLLLGYAGLMLLYNPRLGATVLGFGAVRVAALLALKGRNQQLMASELAAAGREGGAQVEALTGLETTQASGSEGWVAQRWAHRMIERVNSGLERRRLVIGSSQLMLLLQGAAAAGVFLVGGQELLEHRMTLGMFASFLMLQSLFLGPLETLLETVSQLQYLTNHLRRLDDVLETEREPSGTLDPGRLNGAIELRDVSYSYAPGAPPVLRNVSLSIRPGEKVALVGPSGAGKSTLMRLLLGLHLPSSGQIAFDGRDLRELDLQKLRRQMGVVLQETFLFDDTVRANLSLRDETVPLERLRWAARVACIDDLVVALSEGYDSRVGENGCLLSGGERQRLNLARALAHDPAVLLLDEATSSLDLELEQKVHAHLATLGCTRIVVAHRMVTVKDADRILVLREGTIVQEGTFEELRRSEGMFQQLVHAQESARA